LEEMDVMEGMEELEGNPPVIKGGFER